MLTLGIQTPPEHTTFQALRDIWQAADELGFRAAFTFDHFLPLNPVDRPDTPTEHLAPGPQLEAWVSLAHLAASTSRLEVGTLVSGVTYRHPSLLAKMVVTLDHATNGRAILGLGASWHQDEHYKFGLDFPPVGERMGRLDEALAVFRALSAADQPANFDGRWYQLRDAFFDPRPVHAEGIPTLVGGSGSRLKRIAARHATMFNGFAAPWEWPRVNEELDELLAKEGRAPADLERTAFVFSELSGDPEREKQLVAHFQRTRGGTEEEVRKRVVLGDPDQAGAVLASYREAGISLVILNLRPPFPLQGLARFGRDVLPRFS
jgi:alkanesulfonate monooxygenase SsuD/methylene tetrahydromethanopterin reductase-like flavin-dependent oxidoreductase (luciferase family)